jgi:hypothetical protein
MIDPIVIDYLSGLFGIILGCILLVTGCFDPIYELLFKLLDKL